jgi:hypothetical protein
MPEKSDRPQQKDLLTKRWRVVTRPKLEARSLHIPLVAILRWALKPDVMMRHYPSGEARDKRIAAKLKAMGTMAGCADLEFFWDAAPSVSLPCKFSALFMELKTDTGRPSLAQQIFGPRVTAMGARYCIVRSIDEALEILKQCDLLRPDVKVEKIGRRVQVTRPMHL